MTAAMGTSAEVLESPISRTRGRAKKAEVKPADASASEESDVESVPVKNNHVVFGSSIEDPEENDDDTPAAVPEQSAAVVDSDDDDDAPELFTTKSTKQEQDAVQTNEAKVEKEEEEQEQVTKKKHRSRHRKNAKKQQERAEGAKNLAAVLETVSKLDLRNEHMLPKEIPESLRIDAALVAAASGEAAGEDKDVHSTDAKLDVSTLAQFASKSAKREAKGEAKDDGKPKKKKSQKTKDSSSRTVSGIHVVATKPKTPLSLLNNLSQVVPTEVSKFVSERNASTKRVPRGNPLEAIARAKKLAVTHYRKLRYLGAVPQFLVLPALAQCTPEELESLENLNPHIVHDNESLWRQHCIAKYKELESLASTEGAVSSWREKYRELRLRDELVVRQKMERVRGMTARVERERNARKIKITNVVAVNTNRATRAAPLKSLSLVQRARKDARARMSMLGVSSAMRSQPYDTAGRRAVSSRAPAAPAAVVQRPAVREAPMVSPRGAAPTTSAPHRQAKPSQPLAQDSAGYYYQRQQQSPAASPAQSPAYYPSSYSPPYFSSASSGSPTHSTSAYSPPYVPDAGSLSPSGHSREYRDYFDSTTTTVLPPTVVIKEQTRLRRRGDAAMATTAKRKRDSVDKRESSTDDSQLGQSNR
ncbi:Elongin-A [Coemansia sp. Benny D115]|nr:Elongin-A [Coemansia sp. Benny D115]